MEVLVKTSTSSPQPVGITFDYAWIKWPGSALGGIGSDIYCECRAAFDRGEWVHLGKFHFIKRVDEKKVIDSKELIEGQKLIWSSDLNPFTNKSISLGHTDVMGVVPPCELLLTDNEEYLLYVIGLEYKTDDKGEVIPDSFDLELLEYGFSWIRCGGFIHYVKLMNEGEV